MYDSRADVWSLGITLLEITSGQHPYGSPDMINNTVWVYDHIKKVKADDIIGENMREKYSKEACAFLQSCLQPIELRSDCIGLVKSVFYESYAEAAKRNEFVMQYVELYKVK